MSVVVSCRCGQQFKTDERHAGKCVPCPACGSRMTIPAPDVPEADPLGIGQLTTPIESQTASSVYSAGRGYDSTERLAMHLAWIAGGSVALMAFAMFITYLIYRFPNSPTEPAPAVAAVERRVERSVEQVADKPFAPAPASNSVAPAPAAPTPSPPVVFGPPASTNERQITPPEATTIAGSSKTTSSPSSSPSAAAATGEVGVTRLPDSVQAWFEQPGDTLKGLRRIGTSETPATHFSWMTGLLPYLDQQKVYDQIDFNQPVTSKGNLQAGAVQIPAFLNPLDDQQRWKGYPFEGLALTHFAGMSGVEDARNVVAAKLPRSDPRAGVFGYDDVARPAQITDGLSQTIMLVGAGVLANPWLFGGGGTIRGAREPLFDKTSGLGMKGLSGGGTIVVMADGSVRHVSENVDPRVFKAMCTIHGADSVDLDRAAPSFALEQLRPAGQSLPRSSYGNQRATGH